MYVCASREESRCLVLPPSMLWPHLLLTCYRGRGQLEVALVPQAGVGEGAEEGAGLQRGQRPGSVGVGAEAVGAVAGRTHENRPPSSGSGFLKRDRWSPEANRPRGYPATSDP